MNALKLTLFLSLFAGQLFAQEQMALRLNDKGIMKILQMAVRYNTATKEARTIVIPQNIYKFNIPKARLVSNPIIPVINEISDLNMNRDLDFYFNTTDIKIQGNVEAKSLKSTIFNSSDSGFDVKLTLNISQVVVTGPRLSLCEDKQKNTKNCGSGLKASLTDLKIITSGRPVVITMILRLRSNGKVARVTVRSVESNLEGSSAPNLDISFKALEIPRIAIVINGQESELDTSKLKDEILKRKSYLAKQLLAFAGDFIANDVAEMINVYLINKEIATSYQLYRKDNKRLNFDEFLSSRNENHFADVTHVRPPFIFPTKQPNPIGTMMAQVSEIIRSAQVAVSLKKISTPGNKDIELAGLVNFVLNGKQIKVKNTLGNSSRTLPKLDLTPYKNSDINLALSEPLINGALDLVNSTNLFQEVFEATSPVEGFSIKSIKMHFSTNKAMVAVVNAQVDLKKLKSKGVKQWFKNTIAAWLERNNNNGIIYFPIEVTILPVFKALPNGGAGLDLRVLSPFVGSLLANRFNYPTNVPDMTDTVKEGVMDELKDSLEPHTNKTYNFDLSKYLNQSGVVFLPKSISINQGAYLLMNLNIVDIKFNNKNPNQR
jgi:hypothetical protein